jgi:hypothetical protein
MKENLPRQLPASQTIPDLISVNAGGLSNIVGVHRPAGTDNDQVGGKHSGDGIRLFLLGHASILLDRAPLHHPKSVPVTRDMMADTFGKNTS